MALDDRGGGRRNMRGWKSWLFQGFQTGTGNFINKYENWWHFDPQMAVLKVNDCRIDGNASS